MRINIRHILYGKIKIGRKIYDLFNFQIRDEISPDHIRKCALECAEKIRSDQNFNNEPNISIFNNDLLKNVMFIPTEPDWIDSAKIAIFGKRSPRMPKAIITIPSDYKPEEAKGSTFHETIHLLGEYTNHDLLYDENLVNNMVEFYLCDDKDALFERIWPKYTMSLKIQIARLISSIAIGIIIGMEIQGLILGKGNRSDMIIIASAIGYLICYIACYKLIKKIKRKSMVF